MRFRESGARGGLVDGMIEIKDENTFIRHYEFFTPKGEVKYRSDSWTFDPANLNCFIWQTTTYKGNEPTTYPGRKYCKKIGAALPPPNLLDAFVAATPISVVFIANGVFLVIVLMISFSFIKRTRSDYGGHYIIF